MDELLNIETEWVATAQTLQARLEIQEDNLDRTMRFGWEKAAMLGPAQHSMASDCLLVELMEEVAHHSSLVEAGRSILPEGRLALKTAIQPPGCAMR